MTNDPDNFYADRAIPDPHNPYAAPADVGEVALPAEDELATLSARWVGAFIDGLILIPALIAIVFVAFSLGETGVFGENMVAAEAAGSAIGIFLGSLWYLIVNGYLLSTKGQTVGKLVAGTRIVNAETNELVPLWPLFFKRWISIQLLAAIPVIGNFVALVDVLMIFRKNRKCLHDDLAGTKVIKVS